MLSIRRIKNFAVFLTVLMSILLSKSYYFGIANRGTYQYVYYLIVVAGGLFVGIKFRRMMKTVMVVLPLLVLMMVNIVLNFGSMNSTNVNQVLGIGLTFICVAVTAIYVTPQQFSKWYIDIMAVICAVSLLCIFIAVQFPDLAYSLCQPGYDWTVPVGYSFFYTWGWNGIIFSRNSGIFWEPGAFQGFIMIALLMILYECDRKSVRDRKGKFILFLVTLLTTQSSTGYILLMFLILTQWQRLQFIFGHFSKSMRNVLVVAMAIAVVAIIVSSNNISDKFTGTHNNSASIRFGDVVGGWGMILRGGLFGLGETMEKEITKSLYGVNVNDSVGLNAMAYTYGILFAIYYIGMMAFGVMKYFGIKKISDMIATIAIFIVLHMTEGLWWLPVYILIPVLGITYGRNELRGKNVPFRSYG